MPKIEGFQVKNFRGLKDVKFGKVSAQDDAIPLTPLSAVIGRNGSGKSSLFDAFGFLADCLRTDVETACDLSERGGYKRLCSQSEKGPIEFVVRYSEIGNKSSVVYSLSIVLDEEGRPIVDSEILRPSSLNTNKVTNFSDKYNEETALMINNRGSGVLSIQNSDKSFHEFFDLSSNRILAISTLGSLKKLPEISRFQDFMKGWYLSYFRPDAARTIPASGPQRVLSKYGDNIANVVQFLQYEHEDRFKIILRNIANKIPGIINIDAEITIDDRVVLRFNDGSFSDPFFVSQMSDGTLKLFSYLLLLELPDPPPFICIEEPENGLYPKLLEGLAREFRTHANRAEKPSQMFITTHQPYFVDALSPEEVWILERGDDGFAKIRRASDDPIIQNLTAEGLPLGSLWYSNYLD